MMNQRTKNTEEPMPEIDLKGILFDLIGHYQRLNNTKETEIKGTRNQLVREYLVWRALKNEEHPYASLISQYENLHRDLKDLNKQLSDLKAIKDSLQKLEIDVVSNPEKEAELRRQLDELLTSSSD